MRIRLLEALHRSVPAGSEGTLGEEEAQQGTIRFIELDSGERWALGKARYVKVEHSKLDEFIKARYGSPKSFPESGFRRIRG